MGEDYREGCVLYRTQSHSSLQRKKYEGGSKGKELCVLENCLSSHVSINKSLFLHSGKIIHHLLIINSIILHITQVIHLKNMLLHMS